MNDPAVPLFYRAHLEKIPPGQSLSNFKGVYKLPEDLVKKADYDSLILG